MRLYDEDTEAGSSWTYPWDAGGVGGSRPGGSQHADGDRGTRHGISRSVMDRIRGKQKASKTQLLNEDLDDVKFE